MHISQAVQAMWRRHITDGSVVVPVTNFPAAPSVARLARAGLDDPRDFPMMGPNLWTSRLAASGPLWSLPRGWPFSPEGPRLPRAAWHQIPPLWHWTEPTEEVAGDEETTHGQAHWWRAGLANIDDLD